MRRCAVCLIGCVLAIGLSARWTAGCGGYGASLELRWAGQAVSPDEQIAAQAIDRLRSSGPEGLEALLTKHADLLDDTTRPQQPAEEKLWTESRARLFSAIDKVGSQRDCRASRLFWFTDLDTAKAAAQAQHKPILSLRMMGKLTDEYSCANSRFFRTTLYANSEVGNTLREKFVLHWESVRPVPKVTIDFGDGRKLTRTLTGNSAHYVLSSDGRVIDALPGLYAPKAFLRGLEEARLAFEVSEQLPAGQRDAFFAKYYRDRMTAIESSWAGDLRKVGVELAAANNGAPQVVVAAAPAAANEAAAGNPPGAGKAAVRAESKRRVEIPILKQLQLAEPSRPSADQLASATGDDLWPQIAALHYDDAQLDVASRALIASKNPTAGRAAGLAIAKSVVESPLVRMFRNLQQSIAIDSVRNEYMFRRQILEWLAGDSGAANDVYTLNERVYADLFLTPRRDPWLGLLPADAYTALDNNGVVAAPTAE